MSIEQVRLRWNNHINMLLKAFADEFEREQHVDVTISCKGQCIKAHRIVLDAHSPILRELFETQTASHPIIILNNIDFEDIRSLLEFMYKGKIVVAGNRIQSLLKAAEYLQIKGLHPTNKECIEKEKLPKPQKARTIFYNECRGNLPDVPNIDIPVTLESMWKNLSEEEKGKYFKAAALTFKEHMQKYTHQHK